MSLRRSAGPRTERPDTKTLAKLGQSGLIAVAPMDEGTGTEAASDEARATTRTPVQLWFKGLREPVRARAEVGESGLALKAPLPFLELDSIVGFTTAEGGALLHGRIRRVHLETSAHGSVPQLRIELRLADSPASGEEAGTIVQAAAEHAIAPALPVEPGPAAPDAPQRGRMGSWLAGLALGAAAGAAAVYALLAVRSPQAALPIVKQSPPPSPSAPSAASGASEVHVPEIVRLPSIVEELAADLLAERAQADAPSVHAYAVQPPLAADGAGDAQHPGQAGVEVADADPSAALLALEEEAEGAVPAVAAGPAAQEAQHETEEPKTVPSAPQVTVEGERTRVFVPMRGLAQGMRQYELTTPGLAIVLPKATALVPLEEYAIASGLVRRVALLEHGAGVQVRVITRRPAVRTVVTFDEHGLDVAMEP